MGAVGVGAEQRAFYCLGQASSPSGSPPLKQMTPGPFLSGDRALGQLWEAPCDPQTSPLSPRQVSQALAH